MRVIGRRNIGEANTMTSFYRKCALRLPMLQRGILNAHFRSIEGGHSRLCKWLSEIEWKEMKR